MPLTDAALAELQSRFKNAGNMKFEKRTKKPALQFQKWSVEDKPIALVTPQIAVPSKIHRGGGYRIQALRSDSGIYSTFTVPIALLR